MQGGLEGEIVWEQLRGKQLGERAAINLAGQSGDVLQALAYKHLGR